MAKDRISRRSLLVGSMAAGAAVTTGLTPADEAAAQTKRGRGGLPSRGNVVIRNAYVMTMDAAGDIADGDVHVRDGAIVAVGTKLSAPGASVIDGRGMIVLPGFIETHWHMWNNLFRSFSGDKAENGYFPLTARLGRQYKPSDMYQGTRLSAAEAITSGITTVHSWCHNIRTPDYALEDLRALKESGLRARFSHGWMQGHSNKEPLDLANIERLAGDWAGHSNGGLITLGMAWRGLGGNNPATAVPEEIYRKELEVARRLGIPVTVHASGSRAAAGQIGRIAKAGLLDKGMQVVHAIVATPDEIKAMKDAGATISLSPYSELRIGFGFPQTQALIEAGIPVGLSIDTTVLSGNADMFAIMKVIQNVENAKAESEFKLTARRTLELATIEGARSMGIDATVGSLKAGKRADIIMVDTRDVNIGVFTDPAHMLVTAAQPSNIDTVMVDGRVLKRRGRLTHMDRGRVVSEARAALADLRKRAGA